MEENAENIIEVENLVKKFGNFIANNNLSFQVKKSEIFGFLGANGAGKTTAIKILSGLSFPTSGKVMVAGYDVYKYRDIIKKNIGYMSQGFSLYEDLTVKENIEFYAGIYGLKPKEIKIRFSELVDKLGIAEMQNKFVKDLPLGWKQKIAFSVAIFHKPKVVFLDEPTSGVDPITRRQFWDLIYEAVESGITVFITTHYLDEAEYCDRISIMVEGRIDAIGTPSDLKQKFKAKNMDEVFVKLVRNNENIINNNNNE